MITLPYPSPKLMPNRTKGHHWGGVSAIRKRARNDAYLITKNSDPIDLENGLSITIFTPTKHRRDTDNLLAAMKPYLDGVAQALGVDDTNFNPLLITRVDGVGKDNARVELESLNLK